MLADGLVIRPRLIPACAGKTMIHDWPATGEPAHPRVCGENIRLRFEA